jgi:Ni,Fe-hydrogenase III small subunit
MSQWVIKGLRTGIKTTVYPRAPEPAAGVTPGRPLGGAASDAETNTLARCPTGALVREDGRIAVDYGRCVHCYRCVREPEHPLDWESSYEWAEHSRTAADTTSFGRPFRRSLHVLVVDAGDCGACLNEVRQLNNPYYNMHRLGFFITPSPRHADLLVVVGPVTDHMREALEKIHAAMPAPKRVVAVGACALSGGVFAESFVCARGVRDVLPVDVAVPGHPPPPLAILHGLLVAAGRRAPAPVSHKDEPASGSS